MRSQTLWIAGFLTFFSSLASADTTGDVPANPMGQWLMLIGFALIFYFMIWRPQSQRQKAQSKMISELEKGDEVVTIGGVLGKITNIKESFISVEVASGVELTVQKQSITNVLPKGTMAG
jgi:preprotein translocase subunit YajC